VEGDEGQLGVGQDFLLVGGVLEVTVEDHAFFCGLGNNIN
jgi:hypothetical protein